MERYNGLTVTLLPPDGAGVFIYPIRHISITASLQRAHQR